MSILSEILATTRTHVEHSKSEVSAADLQRRIADLPAPRDFRGALAASPGAALIAEVKKASPSKGIIREDFDPIAIARAYAENGAACLSVLTDEPYFKGKLAYLRQIRETVPQPLLRKDFIVDSWQIYESRVAGADAILLIVAALCPADLRTNLAVARECGLAALVEVHDREELQEALSAGADLVGINNRDLHTFRTSIDVTLNLLRDRPADRDLLFVSESGIFTRADVLRLQEAGVDAVLVGESLMRETDIGAKVRELMGAV
ncbi:MAG TPA: indole-3-glycerol phosphate synthase TrpC [Chthonomonadaceae bacterium]|nr:indole-3-glycerol phosphate synthase TrpC [Chthonomonadaceae bacterium]